MPDLKLRAFVAIAVVALLTNCAGPVKNMREVEAGDAAITPQKDKAMVVFMRPSGMGYLIQSSVFELKGDEPQLAGIIAAKTKVAYHVEPGKHTFMTVGENAEFLSADLLPNKTYYVYVSPRMGMWKARFALEAKHKADLESAELKSDLVDCRWVAETPQSRQWMQDNMPSIQAKRADYYPEWVKKPDAEKERLLPEDGY